MYGISGMVLRGVTVELASIGNDDTDYGCERSEKFLG